MIDTSLILLELFVTFFVIGLFTFGGGYAMLSLIQTQVVTNHQWITESTFTDIIAISQMTPGPIGVNCATYVGYEVMAENVGGGHLMGILGSMTATFAIVLPSFLIVLVLAILYQKIRKNPLFEGVISFLRPAVVGLIGAAALILIFRTEWSGTPLLSSCDIHLIRENFIDWKSWLLLGASTLASFKFKVNPILIIIGAGLLGLVLY